MAWHLESLPAQSLPVLRRLPYWPLCICMLSLQTSTRLTKLTDVDSISFYVSFEDCAKLIMLIFY